MVRKKNWVVLLYIFFTFQSVFCAASGIDINQFKQHGYVELCDTHHGSVAFNELYQYFDEFVKYLQTHQVWAQKIYRVKQSFIRSQAKNYYSTDFFGLYDESMKAGRNQISFYYSIHFHDCICSHYPEINNIPEVINFLQACYALQKPYGSLFQQVADDVASASIFSCDYGFPPILLKVVKYLPGYIPQRPHYDGTAFSLFLDSTDNQSLLLAPYASSLQTAEFFVPIRMFERLPFQNSILLIPGCFLTEYAVYPTPHIVIPHGTIRYATIAFAMRPHYVQTKHDFAVLPILKN